MNLDAQFDTAVAHDDANDKWKPPAQTEPILIENPVWKGCPLICQVAWLPAFDSKQAAIDWHEAPGKGNPLYEPNRIVKIGKCKACGKWHFKAKPRPPSGATSGTGRG